MLSLTIMEKIEAREMWRVKQIEEAAPRRRLRLESITHGAMFCASRKSPWHCYGRHLDACPFCGSPDVHWKARI